MNYSRRSTKQLINLISNNGVVMSPLKYTIIKRGKYTMGYICSELDISPSFWSQLVNGKRSASQALAEKCAATCNRLFETDIFTPSDFQPSIEESHP